MDIPQLSEMQRQAGDAIRQGRRDVVVLSPTGTGKTLAYLLPMAQMLDASTDTLQALVVVPGRELALQSDRVLHSLGAGLRSAACYGGRAAMDEHRRLRELKPHVVFGTPGRLNDHLDKGNLSAPAVRLLVIDEFDKCLEMGFHDEMERLLRKLPSVEQRVLLSATDADQIPRFVKMGRVQRIDFLNSEAPVSPRIKLFEVKSADRDKLHTLSALLCQLGSRQSIVFLSYRDAVERVDAYLWQQGFSTSAFHGGMEQKQREDAVYKFSNGSASVLISTDLASRGLDIPDVANIIHYHLPQTEQEMVHRVGRTARWDKEGQAFFIVGPEEQLPAFVTGHEQTPIPLFQLAADGPTARRGTPSALTVPQPLMATIYIGKGKKDKLSKGDIVGFLCKQGGLQPAEIGRIDVMDRYAYAAVSRAKVRKLLAAVKGVKIKGLKTVIEPVK